MSAATLAPHPTGLPSADRRTRPSPAPRSGGAGLPHGRTSRPHSATVPGTPVPGAGLPLVALTYLVLACVAAPVVVITAGILALPLLVAVLACMLTLLTGYEWRRLGHPLSPAGVVALTGLLLFVMRPLTVVVNGSTTAGAREHSRRFVGDVADAALVAQGQAVVFYALFGLAYLTLIATSSPRTDVTPAATGDGEVRRARVVLLLAAGVALVVLAMLVHSSGGVQAHLHGLSARSSFLSGRFVLTLGYVPLVVALCLYVLVRRHHPETRGIDHWTVSATTLLLLQAAATGGRGPLLLGAVLPLVLLNQAGPRRLSGLPLIGLGTALLGSAMLYSLFLRENVYDGGASMRAFREAPLTSFANRLTSGAEARPFDSLILLNEAARAGDLQLQLGETYLRVLTAFVPGVLLPVKQGGANTWFTMTYLPDYFGGERVETSISAIGEGFANFGYPGIVAIAAVLALAAARLGVPADRTPLRTTLLAIMLTPTFFSFVRGDAFANIPMVIVLAVLCLGMVHVVGSGPTSKGGPCTSSSTRP